MSTEITDIIRNCETDLLAGQAAGVEPFLYHGRDLFEFTKRAVSASFGLDVRDSAEVTSKASRS